MSGIKQISLHDRSVSLELLLSIAILVDDLHLLDNCALPRFAGTQEEYFTFVAEFAGILVDYRVDLLVDGLFRRLHGVEGGGYAGAHWSDEEEMGSGSREDIPINDKGNTQTKEQYGPRHRQYPLGS